MFPARAQEILGWELNRFVYPDEPWDQFHALDIIRASPPHSIIDMLADTPP